MKRIKEHADFLSLMHKHGKNPGERKRLMAIANKGEVDACCEIYLNALKGNFDVTPSLARNLRKHKKQCCALVDRRVSTSHKKRILSNQTGGFLPLLIGALSPLLTPLVKALVSAVVGR